MPLVDMADYVGGLEEANFSMAIPGQYPLGINGLGVTDADCASWLDDNTVSSAEYKRWGCGDDGKAVNPAAPYMPSSAPATNIKFNSFVNDSALAQNVNPQTNRYVVSPAAILKGSVSPTPGSSGTKSTAQQIVDSISAAATAFAPMFKKDSKPKIVVQKDPDYTTYAVIGGAVVVASVLAIAIGKSGGRRKD